MPAQANAGRRRCAHIVVVGNEKGGSGKSTTAMHVAVALMNAEQRVATIDLDSRQKSFTHFIERRSTWVERVGSNLKIPVHFCIARGEALRLEENEEIEFAGYAEALASVESSHDFVVVDTPGTDSYLARLAHSMADTLITPLNDSFVDLDVLAVVDPLTYAITGDSHYAELVRETRRHRRLIDGGTIDWIVVRNRLSVLASHNKQLVGQRLDELADRLGFRCVEGLAERVIYRELFPRGLTVLDSVDEIVPGTRPSASHQTARHEVTALIEGLRLPLDVRRHAAARAEWTAAQQQLPLHDVVTGAAAAAIQSRDKVIGAAEAIHSTRLGQDRSDAPISAKA